jgi:hypothetical protein
VTSTYYFVCPPALSLECRSNYSQRYGGSGSCAAGGWGNLEAAAAAPEEAGLGMVAQLATSWNYGSRGHEARSQRGKLRSHCLSVMAAVGGAAGIVGLSASACWCRRAFMRAAVMKAVAVVTTAACLAVMVEVVEGG